MTVTHAPLRYYGGKFKLAPWIIEQFPKHTAYVEPYGGGASVLLRKKRSRVEIYNDLDKSIVNFFSVLRDPELAGELIRLVKLTPFARDEFELAYEDTDDPVEQARRTAILSMMAFGSTGLFKKSTGFRAGFREWKTPAHDWQGYPGRLLATIDRLQGVTIENRPAIEIIKRYDREGVLFYLDPPYPLQSRSRKNRMTYAHEMTEDDHKEMVGLAKSLKGDCIISGYHCPLYKNILGDWEFIERAHYAGSARGKEARTEVLWLSPGMKKRQPGLFDGVE